MTWQEELYQKIFDDEIRGLERGRSRGIFREAADVERILASLYELDGSDWLGRGEAGDQTIAAQIAAYEAFIHDWKNLRDNSTVDSTKNAV